MKSYRTLLTIVFSLTLSSFVCQAIAAERTIKLQPVSETPGKLEVTKSKPKTISTKTPDKLRPVTKTPDKRRPVTKTPDKRRPVTKSPAKVTAIGFCCKDGKNSSSTKADCQRSRGAYFTTEREAILKCTGYCCADFAVSQATEKKCKSARGKYFGNKQKADRFCDSQKGFCCIDGKTRRLTKRECTAKRGEFFTSKKIAAKECKQEAGYCNLKGKTQRLKEAQCLKKKGYYFATPILAKKNLVKMRQQKLAEKQADKKGSATKGKVAADLKLKKDLGAASSLALQKKPENLTLSIPDHYCFNDLYGDMKSTFRQVSQMCTFHLNPSSQSYIGFRERMDFNFFNWNLSKCPSLVPEPVNKDVHDINFSRMPQVAAQCMNKCFTVMYDLMIGGRFSYALSQCESCCGFSPEANQSQCKVECNQAIDAAKLIWSPFSELDDKADQYLNMLSIIMKQLKEMQMAVTRNQL